MSTGSRSAGGPGDEFGDELVGPATTDLPDRFFDRFMFNLHPVDASGPGLIVGAGIYPGANTIDGFLLVVGDEQRNLRFSTDLDRTDGHAVGPFRWVVERPMRRWQLQVGPNPTGVELDVVWEARAPAWFGDVTVRDGDTVSSSFEHLFQSGLHRGTLTIDGQRHDVDGWYGQRDRSRGVRTMAGGQGLHVWFQAQFPDRSVGFLLVEDRAQGRLLLEGAVMHTDGTLDEIVDVRHALEFDDGLDLRAGTVVVTTARGTSYDIDVDAGGRGTYMAGGGYGGHHGTPGSVDHVEHDSYALDGSVSPRTVDTALTDRFARFDWAGTAGSGVFEFAHSRSTSYRYRPSL